MAEYLIKSGAMLSVTEVYGLLYGCLAAPKMVLPSQLIPEIFGDHEPDRLSKETVELVIGNILSLWNILGAWEAGKEPLLLPDIEYLPTFDDTKRFLTDICSLVSRFARGLDLGRTAEQDLSKEGNNAIEGLFKMEAIVNNIKELYEKEGEDKELDKTRESIHQAVGVVADCIARIHIDLKCARIRTAHEMRAFASFASKNIERNAPCPCGSGKKYKHCCGKPN